jgi:hypothetical protein
MWQPLIARRRSSSKSAKRPPKKTGARRCIRFERLEGREVLSATFGSAMGFGGPAGSDIFDVATDAAGNSYVTGFFGGTVDFDLSQTHVGDVDILTARGENDAFVAKYAPDDSLVWARRMGGDVFSTNAITDVGRSIAVDNSGNVYVAGDFRGSADFGSTILTTTSVRDRFVVKLNAAGSFAWARQMNDGGMSRGVGVDASGNVYAFGRADLTSYDVAKFTAAGQIAWRHSLMTNTAYDGDLAVSAAGKVYVVGEFSGTVDFDLSSKKKIVAASQGAFVWSLDTNGKFSGLSTFNGYAPPRSVVLDGGGNIVVGGYYYGTVDFNPGRGVTTLDPAGGGYIAKLNNSGSLVWARALTGEGVGSVHGLSVDAAGAIYAAGYFTSSIDLDPGAGVDVQASAGGYDVFLVKLSATGNYVWGETFGGVTNDWAWGVAVDAAGTVHLVGYFTDIVDFDPDPLTTFTLGSPGGRRNGFLLRLQQA